MPRCNCVYCQARRLDSIPFSTLRAVVENGPIYAAETITDKQNEVERQQRRADRHEQRADQLLEQRDEARKQRDELTDELAATQDAIQAAAIEADKNRREQEALAGATSLVWSTAPATLTLDQARRRAAVIAYIASDDDYTV